jgi:alpha-galactosidase
LLVGLDDQSYLYLDAGFKTCGNRPGSLGYETKDANTYASWNIDYLKYDECNTDGSIPEVRYPVMRDALNASGRTIFYALCGMLILDIVFYDSFFYTEQGTDNPALWAPNVGNSWRTTQDISDNWNSMINNIDIVRKLASHLSYRNVFLLLLLEQ